MKGFIIPDDIIIKMEKLGMKEDSIELTMESFENIVEHCNVSQSGYFDYEEFFTAACDPKKIFTPEHLKKAFTLLSKGSGKLTKNTFLFILP